MGGVIKKGIAIWGKVSMGNRIKGGKGGLRKEVPDTLSEQGHCRRNPEEKKQLKREGPR